MTSDLLVPVIVAVITATGVVIGPVVLARVRASLSVSRPEPTAVYSTAEAFVRAIADDNNQLRLQMASLRDEMKAAKAECDKEIAWLRKELDRQRRRPS